MKGRPARSADAAGPRLPWKATHRAPALLGRGHGLLPVGPRGKRRTRRQDRIVGLAQVRGDRRIMSGAARCAGPACCGSAAAWCLPSPRRRPARGARRAWSGVRCTQLTCGHLAEAKFRLDAWSRHFCGFRSARHRQPSQHSACRGWRKCRLRRVCVKNVGLLEHGWSGPRSGCRKHSDLAVRARSPHRPWSAATSRLAGVGR